jgi:hypothetical protein
MLVMRRDKNQQYLWIYGVIRFGIMTPVLICGHISLLDCDVLYDMPADI